MSKSLFPHRDTIKEVELEIIAQLPIEDENTMLRLLKLHENTVSRITRRAVTAHGAIEIPAYLLDSFKDFMSKRHQEHQDKEDYQNIMVGLVTGFLQAHRIHKEPLLIFQQWECIR